jgi:1-deoxy-D-xylulose-5-phosphate reductoisomerase
VAEPMRHVPARLAVLGSTGSIGQQTLDIVRSFPDRFQVFALAAGANARLLSQQAQEFRPSIVYANGNASGSPPRSLTLEEIAELPEVDIVVVALSGEAGLLPTIAAVKAGKRIALANKESLVEAGEMIMADAVRTGARIMPVDSEHSAIWQCLAGETAKAEKIILTASGGPFRGRSGADMARVTLEQALNHPSWKMGKKVTIDSATMMNKGLEVIEAHWLFDMPFESISVVVHPQSYVHSMVQFADGSIKAQLGCPDMRLPIQYALCYPDRLPNHLERLDLAAIGRLEFEQPDLEAFPCLRLAVDAGLRGGTSPAVLAAADECAVGLFLEGRISFADIAFLVEGALNAHQSVSTPSLEEILSATRWAREWVLKAAAEK